MMPLLNTLSANITIKSEGFMGVHERTIIIPTRNTSLQVWFIGDTHVGSRDFVKHKLDYTVKRIADNPNAYWIGMGDYCDFIGYNDPRFDPDMIDPDYRIDSLRRLAETQMRHFLKLIEPIREKCLVILIGNHEDQWERRYHYDIGTHIAERMNKDCKAIGYEGFFRLKVADGASIKRKASRYKIDFYLHHGYGGARTTGANLNKIEAMAADKDVDVLAMGHCHKLAADASLVRVGLRGDSSKMQERPLAVLLTGSYQALHNPSNTSSWAARKGFKTTKLGSPRLVISVLQHFKNDELIFEGIA